MVTPTLFLLAGDSFMSNWGEHLSLILGSVTAWSIIGHVVNTFPTPENKYGRWLLSSVQYAVGQRVVAQNTKAGLDTVAVPVAKGEELTVNVQGTMPKVDGIAATPAMVTGTGPGGAVPTNTGGASVPPGV